MQWIGMNVKSRGKKLDGFYLFNFIVLFVDRNGIHKQTTDGRMYFFDAV